MCVLSDLSDCLAGGNVAQSLSAQNLFRAKGKKMAAKVVYSGIKSTMLCMRCLPLFVLFTSILPLYAGVNPDGSFSETLPIEIPAGRNGVQPQLALTYNSNAGNGIVGVGFSLQGLPAITRISYGRGINYDGQDTYVGPEGRLIMVSGASTPLGNPPIYHAENETWSKYEPLGNDGQALTVSNRCGGSTPTASEPCQWRVTDRSGMVYLYGADSQSRALAIDAAENPLHSGAVRQWALTRVTDLNGNYYEVEYYQNAGQIYPKRIRYTYGPGASKYYTITFAYDESGRPDKEISYASSSFVQTAWRLREVLVEAEQPIWWIFSWTVQVRRYELGYDGAAGLLVSRLKTWREFDAAEIQRPVIELSWPTLGNATYSTWQEWFWAGTLGATARMRSGDFNGDGRTDLVWVFPYQGSTVVRTAISTGSGYEAWQEWFWSGEIGNSGRILTGDYNGDGRTDLQWVFPYQGNTVVRTAISTGNGYATWQEWFWAGEIGDNARLLSGDYDGDGKTDLQWIFPYQGSTVVRTAISTGNGYSPWQEWFWAGEMDNNARLLSGDYNGDGRTDLQWVFPYQSSTVVRTAISTGSGYVTWPEWFWAGAMDVNARMLAGDFNGDGRTDLQWIFPYQSSTVVRTAVSTGAGYTAWQEWFWSGVIGDNAHVLSGDFNLDGKTDIQWIFPYQGSTVVRTAIATNRSYAPWQEWFWAGEMDSNAQMLGGDYDGRGKSDLQWIFPYQQQTVVRTATPNLNSPTRLLKITNGLGTTTEIKHQTSTEMPKAVCKTACTGPQGEALGTSAGIPNSSPRYLVTEVTTTSDRDLTGDGVADSFTTRYEYYNGRVATGTVAERASLGFEKIKTTDVNSGNYSITTYRQDKPFQGSPAVIRSYLANGTLLSESISAGLQQYLCDESGCTIDAANSTTPSLPKQIRQSGESILRNYENGSLLSVKYEEVLSQDVYGNMLRGKNRVVANGAERVVYKFVVYLNETLNNRVIGLPVSEKLCYTQSECVTGDNDFFSESRIYYDDGAFGTVGARHLATRKESFMPTNAGTGVWVNEVFTYNAAGGLTTSLGARGILTTISYDSES